MENSISILSGVIADAVWYCADSSYVDSSFPSGNALTLALARELGRSTWITRRDYAFNNTTLYWHRTAYDAEGRPTETEDSLTATRQWLYNRRSELVGTAGTQAHPYDSIGNRLTFSDDFGTATCAANNLNQYTAVNRTIEQSEQSNNSSVEYFWGNDLSGTEQGAGGVGGLVAVSVDGAFFIPCYDHNGNVVCYVSESGAIAAQYVYDPYGNVIEQYGALAGRFAIRFSTKYTDVETGLISYLRRFYRPDHGRWLNRDPIEERGGENLYAFCLNNPILYVDLYGMSFWGYFHDGIKMLTGILSIAGGVKMMVAAGWTGIGAVGGAAFIAYGADQVWAAYQNMKSRYEGRGLPTGTVIQTNYRKLSYTITGKQGSVVEKVFDWSYRGFEFGSACATGWGAATRTISVIQQVKPLQTVGKWVVINKWVRYQFNIEGGVSASAAAGVAVKETFNVSFTAIGLMDSPTNDVGNVEGNHE